MSFIQLLTTILSLILSFIWVFESPNARIKRLLNLYRTLPSIQSPFVGDNVRILLTEMVVQGHLQKAMYLMYLVRRENDAKKNRKRLRELFMRALMRTRENNTRQRLTLMIAREGTQG